jgi:hypothetical protein
MIIYSILYIVKCIFLSVKNFETLHGCIMCNYNTYYLLLLLSSSLLGPGGRIAASIPLHSLLSWTFNKCLLRMKGHNSGLSKEQCCPIVNLTSKSLWRIQKHCVEYQVCNMEIYER